MGCDIHLMVEKKNASGKWERQGVRVCDDRNYAVFAALAGARNDWGLKPVAEPRGWPEDCSVQIDDDGMFYDGGEYLGDHSFSWLNLDEVLAYNWDQNFSASGVVPWEAFLKWREDHKEPESYCQMICGPRIVVLDLHDAESRLLLAAPPFSNVLKPFPPETEFHTRVHWTVTLREWSMEFLKWAHHLRAELPGEVRLVFGFDS